MKPWVAIAETGTARYPKAPFDPPNPVSAAVEELFRLLELDATHYGTPAWNPLGFIPSGARVLIKPNLVRHFHPLGFDTDSLYTHGSLIRVICDYVLKALNGTGQVIIADAPLQTCSFSAVCELSGLSQLDDHYRRLGHRVEIRDLRLVCSTPERKRFWGSVLVKHKNVGDPSGYTRVDLGARSLHASREGEGRYRVTCYDPASMNEHHGRGKHEYIIANTLLESDVVLNLPKVKTHQKAGLTGALKNFVGINGHKDCLPHHLQGPADSGGDEYAHADWAKRLDSWLQDLKEIHPNTLVQKSVAAAHRLLYRIHMNEPNNAYWAGSWHGNDTISRTTIDLNRIVQYARRDGSLASTPQRQVFTIADAILAGEDDGPLAPTPKPAGLVVGGDNLVAVDMILARLMGFRWEAIPTLRHGLACLGELPLFDGRLIQAVSNSSRWHGLTPDLPGESLEFRAHRGWRGHIERIQPAPLSEALEVSKQS
jgi:uncharacterized protein (DUF362 family)